MIHYVLVFLKFLLVFYIYSVYKFHIPCYKYLNFVIFFYHLDFPVSFLLLVVVCTRVLCCFKVFYGISLFFLLYMIPNSVVCWYRFVYVSFLYTLSWRMPFCLNWAPFNSKTLLYFICSGELFNLASFSLRHVSWDYRLFLES